VKVYAPSTAHGEAGGEGGVGGEGGKDGKQTTKSK
jgi:hypothetical protein